MDLLLQAGRTPSTQKALISLLGLILHPQRGEREANEYRGGNVRRQHMYHTFNHTPSLHTCCLDGVIMHQHIDTVTVL